VAANLRAAAAKFDGAPVVNIACGGRTSLNEIIRLLNELTSQTLPTHFLPLRPGDVRDSQADLTLAGRILGYEPNIDVREGLRRTLEWYRSK
jgi:nucleoside-diphosphate-sugar epimerase